MELTPQTNSSNASKRKVAIICGGPSAERGISLNSARSLYDNLNKDVYEIVLIYFNPLLEPYQISSTQIYSNTPLDFDYKLRHNGRILSQQELHDVLKSVDVVFPAIHGVFGEDGQLQTLLEEIGVPYVGSGPEACRLTSDKHECQKVLQKNGFYAVPDWVLQADQQSLDVLKGLEPGRYVLKPLHGGSSIGVQYVTIPSSDDVLKHALKEVFFYEEQVLVEPFIEGIEFTLIVLENGDNQPVALLPTEIEFSHQSADAFFNYRKKYLATAETRYHTPARFSPEVVATIRSEAERAFEVLGMKDFARLDGWLLPDGQIWFSDINAISGMEQNSFLFQQASLLGLSHRQLLEYILEKELNQQKNGVLEDERQRIPVLFGGNTAERQVSVMSGTNVWMKLKFSHHYKPVAVFFAPDSKLYQVPAFFCLHHTVEEIEEKVMEWGKELHKIEQLETLLHPLRDRLGITREQCEELPFMPVEVTFEQLAKNYDFVFLGLHGGAGEDGTIQAQLESLGLAYNGPGPAASALCMDKMATGLKISQAGLEGITTAKKMLIPLQGNPEELWQQILTNGFKLPLILKPRGDGCSAGIIKVYDVEHFVKVFTFLQERKPFIPANAIHENHGQIDLPLRGLEEILVEEFISTDAVFIKNLAIEWHSVSDFIEVTVGVLGLKDDLRALNPSQTIASQEVLSLEEKFMGGTGVNLTPPPVDYVNPEIVAKVKESIVKVAHLLGIEGYARIDTFMNIKTGEIIVIEANTLPALTPSTVLFHQGLAEPMPFTPCELIEKIIEIGFARKGA